MLQQHQKTLLNNIILKGCHLKGCHSYIINKVTRRILTCYFEENLNVSLGETTETNKLRHGPDSKTVSFHYM